MNPEPLFLSLKARNENKIATDIQIMIAGGAGGFTLDPKPRPKTLNPKP